MGNSISPLFTWESFIPHGHCYLWQPILVGIHAVSDSLIALAYYSIPITLFYFIRKRQDVPFEWVFTLFGAFIIACGTTHVMEVWTLWHPNYWLSGTLKVMTAGVSVYTAFALVPIVPQALAIPSPALLEATNRELAREVAERRRVEESLRYSEARYRAIVEDQAELVTRYQPDGTLTFINEAYCRFFGRGREQLLGTSHNESLHPDDVELSKQVLSTLTIENPAVSVELRMLVGDETRWMQWSKRAIFGEHGKFLEYQAVGVDVTARKQAEQALQESQHFIHKLADTAPVILYVYDLIDDRNIYVNREISTLLGYTPEEIQVIESSWIACLAHPDDGASKPERNQRWAALNDGDVLHSEHRLQHRNQEWRFFHFQETLFARAADGSPKQILGAAIDITATKQLEEVRQTKEQLQRSLAEKEVLLKEVHHRVKNNLQMVYSLLRLQYRRIQDPQAAALLLESQNRIKSIALIHEKLYRSGDLSKIDFDQYIPNLAASLFNSYNIEPNSISLKTQIDDVALDIDTAILCGLIINELVSNALKYAFQATETGEIFISLSSNENGMVALTVKDNGMGMAQGEASNSSTSTSLGLSLVDDLTHQLQGCLTTHHHHGTEFRITFPEKSS